MADERRIVEAQDEIKIMRQSIVNRGERIKELEEEKVEAIRDKAELEN